MRVRNLFFRLLDAVDDKAAGGGGADPAPAAAAPAAPAAPAAAPAAPVAPAKGAAPPAAAAPGASEGIWWQDDWRAKAAGTDEKMLKRLERYSTPKDALNALAHVQTRISAGELRSALPKDAKPEEIAAWRTENGIPEAADKYDLKLSDGLTIGDEDKPIIGEFLKAGLEVNLNNSQASKVVDWYYGEVERQTEAREAADQQAATAAQDALHAEWGPEYRANINMIESLLDTAPNGVKDKFKFGRLADGTPIMADPDTIRWINGMARQINPVTSIVPNAGGDLAGAIDSEIAGIEKVMRTDRKAYNADDKMQARLRDLYSARERAGAKKA
jgi:hypothetical protein